MANWTDTDLANKTLEHLSVKAAGNSASSEDLNLVTEEWLGLYSRLNLKGYIIFDYNAIPEWAQGPLKKILSEEIATHFGVSGEKRQLIMNDAKKALDDMREQTQSRPNYIPVMSRDF